MQIEVEKYNIQWKWEKIWNKLYFPFYTTGQSYNGLVDNTTMITNNEENLNMRELVELSSIISIENLSNQRSPAPHDDLSPCWGWHILMSWLKDIKGLGYKNKLREERTYIFHQILQTTYVFYLTYKKKYLNVCW